eukprot:XP_001704781.1 Hypothetical protein GL50803_36329 [Giardia lamblia ATCC 50803]
MRRHMKQRARRCLSSWRTSPWARSTTTCTVFLRMSSFLSRPAGVFWPAWWRPSVSSMNRPA